VSTTNKPKPFRLTYNGRTVGGRFASEDGARRRMQLEAIDTDGYPDPTLWAIVRD
jgi:hypothetical protein